MKRVLFITIALLLVSFSASAQLNVKKQSTAPEKIAESIQSRVVLAFSPERGYIMLFVSSNRYDRGLYFLLGEDLDSSIKTLEDLYGLCDTIADQTLTVEPWPNRSCIISADSREGWLQLKFDRAAGTCVLSQKAAGEFLDALIQRKPAVE